MRVSHLWQNRYKGNISKMCKHLCTEILKHHMACRPFIVDPKKHPQPLCFCTDFTLNFRSCGDFGIEWPDVVLLHLGVSGWWKWKKVWKKTSQSWESWLYTGVLGGGCYFILVVAGCEQYNLVAQNAVCSWVFIRVERTFLQVCFF